MGVICIGLIAAFEMAAANYAATLSVVTVKIPESLAVILPCLLAGALAGLVGFSSIQQIAGQSLRALTFIESPRLFGADLEYPMLPMDALKSDDVVRWSGATYPSGWMKFNQRAEYVLGAILTLAILAYPAVCTVRAIVNWSPGWVAGTVLVLATTASEVLIAKSMMVMAMTTQQLFSGAASAAISTHRGPIVPGIRS